MKERVSLLAKSAVAQYVTVFRLILAKRDLGLETERQHIASFDMGGDGSLASKSSLWEPNLLLKMISDQARNLLKTVLKAFLYVSLSTRLVDIRDRLCQQSLPIVGSKKVDYRSVLVGRLAISLSL